MAGGKVIIVESLANEALLAFLRLLVYCSSHCSKKWGFIKSQGKFKYIRAAADETLFSGCCRNLEFQ